MIFRDLNLLGLVSDPEIRELILVRESCVYQSFLGRDDSWIYERQFGHFVTTIESTLH